VRSLLVRSAAWVTLFTFITGSCGGRTQTPHGTTGGPSPLSDRVLVQNKDLPKGLDMRVSDGRQGKPAFDRTKLAPATRLSDADAETLLKRAEPLKAQTGDQQAFALRPASQPPPRTGNVIKSSFPPPASSNLPPARPSDAGKALTVLRYMPEGKVPLAPELSVTFSQPMVAVTSQDDAASVQPVKLSPQPAGHWRWLGTRTILFDPDARFPQATTYQVEVPAGTKSPNGGVLKDAVKFTFETPPPSLASHFPDNGPQRLDVPMFALFDQKIDPRAVVKQIEVRGANGQTFAVELLDAAAIAKHKQLASIVEAANKDEQQGRWLAFRAKDPFPRDTDITVTFDKGTPSAEGPNKTSSPQSFSFHTFPPLTVTEAECGYGDVCRPGMPFSIVFNNPIDADKFDDAKLAISPDIAAVKISQSQNYLAIAGATQAQTTYRVVLSKDLTDEFGQTLGQDTTLSFPVGDAMPTFYGPEGMVVLDPAAKKPTLDFFSIRYDQLKVRLYRVTPDDFEHFGKYIRDQWNHDHPPTPPGKLVFDKLVKTTSSGNQIAETSVDLSAALDHGLGHVVAIVEPSPWKETYEPPRMISWVQATHLAVDAHVDSDSMLAFATDLDTGKAAAGIELEIKPFGIKGKTDDKGTVTLALGQTSVKSPHYLLARRGNDTAFVTDDGSWWSEYGSWNKQSRGKQLTWYVIDDRQMYKPGEEVSLKGWLRMINSAKQGDVEGVGGSVGAVTYRVMDSNNREIAKGAAAVTPVGGFDTKFTLPKTPNLGYARVELRTQGKLNETFWHAFQIQEFRRPEFEVSAQASQGPFVVGNSGDVTVNAKYFAGGPLPGAPVQWYVTAGETSFTPPNRDEYIFGKWEPWWRYEAFDEDGMSRGYQAPKTWSLEAKTDASGAHVMHMDFLSLNPAVPMSVVANASVTDVNRQTWSASSAMIVHPSLAYVGLKMQKPFVEKGTPMVIDVIGVDLDGKALVGRDVEVRAARIDYEYKKGKYQRKELDKQTCTIKSAADASQCTFATKEGGSYEVVATITDDQNRPNQTTLTFWVTGGDQPPAREIKQEIVRLIPDKKLYVAGDTAELLVQAPFYPAEAVVTWRRSGIVKAERVSLTASTTTVKVPITDAMVPNMSVQVDLVGMAVRTDDKGDPDPRLPKRPAYAAGSIDLSIPAKQRTLAVDVSPSAAKLGPGEQASIAVIVKDAQGRPVPNAEAAVIVVDEAVLSLTGYQFGNPIDTFYGARDAGVRDFYERAYVKLARPDPTTIAQNGAGHGRGGAVGDASGASFNGNTVAESGGMDRAMGPVPPPPPAAPKPTDAPMKEAPGRAMNLDFVAVDKDQQGQGGGGQAPIAIRTNFNPLAAFSPAVKTDASGKATVTLKMPDNLTRYRIVAIAAAGEKQFGKGESAVTARLPLMVRPSPPRFLNFGDTFRLPVVLQNQTDEAMTVRVAVRATNATITEGSGREVSVPANDRVEVQFPAAAEMAGTARFQIVGASGMASDAANIELPVWTPATTEAFATYGVIDDGAVAQPVALPGKVVTQFGGLEVTTASTNLQAVTDALLYLVHYPFECAEQRSSRILAIAALRDVLAAFKSKDLPSPAAMEKSVAEDIEHLSQMQNDDGGFAFWDRGYPSEPYLTVFVTNALAHAKAKKFTVPQQLLDRARPYLRDIENHYPWYYPIEVRRAISAYALYTRKQLGDLDIAKAKKLLADAGGPEKLSMETDGWLLGTFAGDKTAADERKAIVRHAMNRVSETAGAANFTTSYNDGNYLLLSSDRRVDGVMLESLIQEQKSDAGRGADLDLIPKIVTGLLAHRKAGHWLNTQENSFILVALDLYFQTYEKVTPDFVARAWLGNDYAGDHAFKGRSTDYFEIAIPMKDVAAHDKQNLTIQKDGKGRLYYRVGMTYAPASLKLEAADYGFVVQRRYEAVDDPADVTRAADGTWHIKAGARVRIKVEMVNENRRYHVALVDPLPAGLETMNPELAVTGPIPNDPKEQQARGAYWWWYGPWYEHQNMRDERVEAFASLLWEGKHDYSYVARATTPGNFVVPPPKAEEMYMPETFGRGASDRVIVE
jgi:uncharacterized protein YfaS (alpha-2-macroglobulin family)